LWFFLGVFVLLLGGGALGGFCFWFGWFLGGGGFFVCRYAGGVGFGGVVFQGVFFGGGGTGFVCPGGVWWGFLCGGGGAVVGSLGGVAFFWAGVWWHIFSVFFLFPNSFPSP